MWSLNRSPIEERDVPNRLDRDTCRPQFQPAVGGPSISAASSGKSLYSITCVRTVHLKRTFADLFHGVSFARMTWEVISSA